jgi:hypothetical protein
MSKWLDYRGRGSGDSSESTVDISAPPPLLAATHDERVVGYTGFDLFEVSCAGISERRWTGVDHMQGVVDCGAEALGRDC